MKKIFQSKKALIGGALAVILGSGAFLCQSNLAFADGISSSATTKIDLQNITEQLDSGKSMGKIAKETGNPVDKLPAKKTETTIIEMSSEIIGITPAALKEEIDHGKTIAEVSKSKGISEEVLVNKMVDKIVQPYSSGKKSLENITFEQYKEIVTSKMHYLVNNFHGLDTK